MSDVQQLSRVLESKLNIESPSLAYVAKAASKTVAFAVTIPYPLLKAWHDVLDSSQKPFSIKYTSYTDLFELAIPGNIFAIKKSAEARGDLNETLRKIASTVNSQYRNAKGRKREELNSKTRRFHVLQCHLMSVTNLERENEELRDTCETLLDELEEWKARYENLQEEKRMLYLSLMEEIHKQKNEIKNLQETNKELLAYIDSLEKLQGSEYRGLTTSQEH